MAKVTYVGPRDDITEAYIYFQHGVPVDVNDPEKLAYLASKTAFVVDTIGWQQEQPNTVLPPLLTNDQPTLMPQTQADETDGDDVKVQVQRAATSGIPFEQLPQSLRDQILSDDELN